MDMPHRSMPLITAQRLMFWRYSLDSPSICLCNISTPLKPIRAASSIQVSIGSFKPSLKRQNEYVETAIGLGRRDSAPLCPAKVCDVDERVPRPRAAVAATERLKNVLRLIDFIICFSKY